MHDIEIWKAIDAAGCYQVSQLGRVRWPDGRIKCPTRARDGTHVVNLYANGRTCVRAVHSLVAEAFHGPRPIDCMVIHKDDDQSNCRADNLAYVPLSLREPRKTSERGKYLVGKLTRGQATEIRKRVLSGESTGALAKEFEISSALVSNIKHGKKWKGV